MIGDCPTERNVGSEFGKTAESDMKNLTATSKLIIADDGGSGLPFPFPGDLPSPGFEPWSLMSPALAGGFFATSATWEACQV